MFILQQTYKSMLLWREMILAKYNQLWKIKIYRHTKSFVKLPYLIAEMKAVIKEKVLIANITVNIIHH